MSEEDSKVVETMERFGGSFVQALAKLCYQADPINLRKIKTTWAEYWKQYEEMSKKV